MNGRRIRLRNCKFTIVDKNDFERVATFSWSFYGGYAKRRVTIGGKREFLPLSNFIMGVPIGVIVDHRSRRTLDNRRANLRIATRQQNNWNTKLRRDNKSGFKGVGWDKESRKWKVEINCNKKTIYLGRFSGKFQAASVYAEAAKRMHGEFASI